MLNIPVLRWGQPYTSIDVDEVVHFATGEPIARVSRANGGLIQRDMRKAQRARDALRADPDRRADRARRPRRRALHERHAADGRRHPDARRVRPRPVGEHRAARADVPGEHEEERVRAVADAEHPDVVDARAVVRRPHHRPRRGAAGADQLSGAEPGARSGPAVEFPRRAHALAADHSDADRAGAEAGPPGAMDAVPDGGGVLCRRHSSRGDLDLSRAGGRRRRGAGELLAQPDLRRHADRRSVPRQSQSAGARSGVLEDPARRRSGGSMGAAPRRHGRQRVRQQRPELHQLLRHLGEPAHARDRRRDRDSALPRYGRSRPSIRTRASRRSRCPAWRRPSTSRSTPTSRRRASRT